MLKKFRGFRIIGFFFLLLLSIPFAAYAEDAVNPVTKIKEKMRFNWGVLDNLGWLFSLIMIVVSLLVIGLLIWCIIAFIWHLVKVRRGKASIKDKVFWLEILVTIFIIFLFVSGLFWDILSGLYSWTSHQDIENTVAAAWTSGSSL